MKAIQFSRIFLVFILWVSACLTGCASTGTTDVPMAVITQRVPEVVEDAKPIPTPQQEDVQPFANRVEWPAFPLEEGATSAYHIESGKADNVWVEGKGYFRGTLEDVYRDLTDEKIIGPTHLTQNIVRDEYVETPEKTTYVMHIKLKYILTVEFDLSAEIIPLYTKYDQSGYLYQSKKTAGTNFIKVISDTILIHQLENGWFSVEFISVNVASKDKEEESRGHLEALFGYWEEASKTR